MIRGFLIILECLTLPFVSLILLPIAFLVRVFSKEKAQAIAQWLVTVYSHITLCICGTEVEVIGEENLPADPCLYVANHRSYFDIIITMTLIKKKTFYIAKKQLGKIPIFRIWLKIMGTLLLDREDIRQSLGVILEAIEKVKSGYSCFIYPEGTRTKEDNHEMLAFKEGSFKISTKSGCPICPIAIIDARKIFEDQAPRFKKARVKIIVGKQINLEDLTKEEKKHIGAYVRGKIENLIKENL